ncbi:UDP-4-amino-4-deoxy-L-arabinose--oxoglutarate aminotransferase [Oceanobacillus picturae]|uniref:UDP-4-amino-4-deoxy-L-arabinose--oxoglutarate aminotransferase n=1 Tax=Oceanobacillus picturae TaxID=171693 RepID=A0A0U9H9M0_9BACI|nr:dTDP-4-amino-4,6-dideoxygalactose transaminase [Oceanobacillus picturae]GAQ19115.1 UDP-4-amino-4-deoxy-L-arabinose--oxoglutarate aminotransferase [Oceanobacillus picturae]
MIPFNIPCVTGKESVAIQQAITAQKLSGNGSFGKKSCTWLEKNLSCERAMLTPSCTAALEMTAILAEVGPGDEVIMPSYTFVSTANAFALRGAAIRFVDIDPATMNIDPVAVEAAITDKTKAIVVVHYAGVACDMDRILQIAEEHGVFLIEDAAQGLMSTYKGKALGTIGHMGTISFHETKNYTCGEGGALLLNDPQLIERAEILQEKGTNRSQFIRGQVDKYTWRDVGSSYLLSELNAAYLSVQLDHAEEINEQRLARWENYNQGLKPLMEDGKIVLPHIPDEHVHNAHIFYIKADSEATRNELMDYLRDQEIMAVSHYVPLHSSVAGKKYGKFIGEDTYTTVESAKLLRLPLYYGLKEEDVAYVVKAIQQFFDTK